MKRLYRLGLFALLVCLFLGQAIALCSFYSNRMIKRELINMQKVREAKIQAVLISFHSYYHVWPVPPGQLDDTALFELGGFNEATINKQHINFFYKIGCTYNLEDINYHNFLFKTDDSIGTCTVYSESGE
jgi:hypothetical protein